MEWLVNTHYLPCMISHVFFQDVVTEVENTPTGPSDRPKKDVTITECGRLDREPFHSEKDW